MTKAVTIVVCTRDRAATLGGTLAALARIRSDHDWEVIVLNNGSVDDTAEVIHAADNCGGRLRYAFDARPGLGSARDVAWRMGEGEIVAFTDDDCYPDPNYVDRLVEAFDDYPDAGCIGGRILLHDPDDARITIDERTVAVRIPPGTFPSAGDLQGANLSFRRDVLVAIGGIDRALGAGTPFPCEDIDAVAALLLAGHAAYFDPRPVVWHHHRRRRRADLAKVRAGYGSGRGAYHAKYALQTGSRWASLGLWLTRTRHHPRVTSDLVRHEVAAARAYLRYRHAYVAEIALLPFFGLLRAVALKRRL